MAFSTHVDSTGPSASRLPVSLANNPDAGGHQWLSVPLPAPGPAVRGRLALFIEGAIERTLEGENAPPPGVGASANLAESLDDQIARSRLTGALGLVLRFASLRGITDGEGAFDTDDSGVLRWLARAPDDRPLHVVFHAGDRDLRVFDRPQPLGVLLDTAGRTSSEAPPATESALRDSIAAMRLAPDLAPAVAEDDAGQATPELERGDTVDERPSGGSDEAALALEQSARLTDEFLDELERSARRHDEDLRESARALAENVAETDWLHETLVQLSTPPPNSGVTARPIAPARDDEFIDPASFATDTPGIELTPASIEDFVAALTEGAPAPEQAESGAFARIPTVERDALSDALVGDDPRDGDTMVDPPSMPPVAVGERAVDSEAATTDDALESDAPESHAPESQAVEMGASEVEVPESDAGDEPAERAEAESNDLGSSGELPSSPDDALGGMDLDQDAEEPADTEPPALDPALIERCETWERELASSHGPKPLSVVERQFTSAYMPLRDAVARGIAGPTAKATLDEWSASFAKSYTDAFEVLRYRGKRPSMVLDLPDLSTRIARLHGARTTQLLLVDGMRFDVGLAVDERLRGLVGGRAACAERLLLWSALPTTTAVQLELIGRGPMGLRDLSGSADDDMLVARGRKASTLRRLRTGHRELMKLDIVESRMAEPGGAAHERVADAADEVADRLAAHFEGVPDRTLVMLFGDHGFVLDERKGGGTEAARQGGASPEEVLVPAFAWVVGAVH